jgi:mannan endo-1,4-beta-mannosidase
LRGRSDRLEVLDAIQAADLKVLRLFISETFENFKNTGSVYMPDIEPQQVGQFDDTQLAAIDQLMVEAHERGKISYFRQPGFDAKMPIW